MACRSALFQEVEAGAPFDSAGLPADDDVVGVPGAPAGGELPQLALLVVDQAARGPGQQRGQDVAHTLAAARRGDDDAMLRPVMAQVMDAALRISPSADIDPGRWLLWPGQQPGLPDLRLRHEPRRAMHALVL